MSEVVILPSMILEGRKAWDESQKQELGVDETLMEIYLAMYGALLIARDLAGETVH